MVTVRDVMTEAPKSVLESDNLVHVARVMRDEDVGCVPVVDDTGRLVGMLTDRDLVVEAMAASDDPTLRQAGELMRGDIHSVDADAPVTHVVETMGRQRVRRLPVVAAGKLVGVVGVADLAKNLPTAAVGELMALISKSGHKDKLP
ncbi:putative signal transduction protein with CBS domains [Catenulispora acidiphila DSM 44928]|jgi:CBS domain-containing protein|uniref:Putative signal transduction protein with CBS domains n=1 Tax=Catenulispora acidiphila (strain DSM 44928 / JCM 14897 / NBRC 102108 / NRRL B-24433 / ID139908) TaxID=479433 RepID=C7Q4M0_CATAD|nr:CBS domain-containing protein [Catenulispora acidiphila]ACU71989.1 putative signal transduction protein with CBS domains [Catenulispora acidiphila DSM 44928]